MYPVVVSISDIDPDGLERETITLATPLHGEGARHHGVSGTAHRTVLGPHTTAGGTVVETCITCEGGHTGKKMR